MGKFNLRAICSYHTSSFSVIKGSIIAGRDCATTRQLARSLALSSTEVQRISFVDFASRGWMRTGG